MASQIQAIAAKSTRGLMTILAQETQNIQNPALGAGLIWRFVCGYTESHRTSDRAPLQLIFLVLPVLYHKATREFVKGTQRASGLRTFAAKFGESKASSQDLLLAIHDRSIRLRPLTLKAIKVALGTRLISILPDGTVIALSQTKGASGIPADAKQMMRDAEKIGAWCSQLTLHEIAATLKLRF